ncbi:TIGR04255 family protein [Sinomonas sp. ASV486]|uniref:TIGR04255 family protein n=1 Tax=Sinomonas sp. ASV486 TaxID=3051170 RepID=UPI0027DAF1D0|nr:TIGR04255 family protein [Sinomonas sp. ASV486]MDQ4489348.1 TIGR04255 family protein [Sinomonas sp. ASV486]
MRIETNGIRVDSDEWDEPLGGIRGMGPVTLERTHLEAAIGEVRFSSDRSELPEREAEAIWVGLGRDSLPVFEKHTQSVVSVTVGPQGASQTVEEQRGWVLATADKSLLFTLLPSTVVVQTSKYERYSASLGDRLKEILPLFTAATRVSRIQRVGLRFINRLSDPGALQPQFWKEHIREDFAGPLAGGLSELVVGQHQQTQLRLDSTATARIQSGFFQEPGARSLYSFLIDLDVFREATFVYDEVLCANMMRQLNRTALALFAHVLSDNYLADLGPLDLARTENLQ